MREFLFIAGLVGLFIVLAILGRAASSATAGVDAQVQAGQLKAELAGVKAEANTLREALEKCKAELKQKREAAAGLRKRVEELERRAGAKR